MTSTSPPFPPLPCRVSQRCSGCAWITQSYERQREAKLAALAREWEAADVGAPLPPIDFIPIAAGGLRDRTDLMIDGRGTAPRLGLFAREDREIIDLENCPQLSPGLNAWLEDFRKVPLSIERGSIRLRVSPAGERGVWLDLANLDVKRLLEERTALDALRARAFIEIGQKRKALAERGGELKLGDPVLKPWFETYIGDEERAAPIFTTVGGFTQPGFQANRVLVREAMKMVRGFRLGRVAEFGSGSGNFTLPLASFSEVVDAYEVDALACGGLEAGAAASGLSERIRIHQGNFQMARNRAELDDVDLIAVDPPRSGLMGFLDPLAETPAAARPKHVLYVSCFAESFALDSSRLVRLGYEPERISLIDQFPQSPHYETVALFSIHH